MPLIYTLPNNQISVSNGLELSGYTQGDGSRLMNQTITLNSNNWETIDISDNAGDNNFEDNDSGQKLASNISYGGNNYTANSIVEAEYTLTVEDTEGNQYTLIGVNIREGGGNTYGTIEGLAFVGSFPPIGEQLTVVGTMEGPSGSTTEYNDYADPPCFCKGTVIETKNGPRLIEDLQVGDLIKTKDHGFQPLRWTGSTELSSKQLATRPELRPLCIRANAFGEGSPDRDLFVSPQHRILISDWRSLVYFAEEEVLAAITHLENGETIVKDENSETVIYFHLLFDDHQVIFSNNLATESFLPGPQTCHGMDKAAQKELFAIFPQLKKNWTGFEAAHPCLKYYQSLVLTKTARAQSSGQSNREVAS